MAINFQAFNCVKITNFLGPTSDESKYVLGSFKSDSLSASNDITASLNDIKHQLLMQRSNLIIENSQKSPTKKMDSKSIFRNGQSPNEKPILMTRRELNDPFGSDEEDENELRKNQRKSPPRELISPPPTIDDVNIYKSIKFLSNFFLFF